MILSERMNNRLNADLEFSRDSQSLIKSRQGEGNSINQWNVNETKNSVNQSKNQAQKNDRYKDHDAIQMGGLIGTSIATYYKGQENANHIQDTQKTEKESFKIERERPIQESTDEFKTQSSAAGIIILTGHRGQPKHQIDKNGKIIQFNHKQSSKKSVFKDKTIMVKNQVKKNLSRSTNFRTVSPKTNGGTVSPTSSNFRQIAQDAKEHQEQEQMLLSNRQIRQQLEIQKQKYEFLLKEQTQGRTISYENQSHRILSAARKQLYSNRSGANQNPSAVKTPTGIKQPHTKIIANLTNQNIPVQYVEDLQENVDEQADIEMWNINNMSDKAQSQGSQTGIQTKCVDDLVIPDLQEPILESAPRKAERVQLPVSGKNYRCTTFDGTTDSYDAGKSASGRGVILIPKIKEEFGLDHILHQVVLEEEEKKASQIVQEQQNQTLKSFCSAILTKQPEKTQTHSRVQSTTQFQIPVIDAQQDHKRFLALRPKTGGGPVQNFSGQNVAALRGQHIEINKSSNTNMFGVSPLGPGSMADNKHSQLKREHFSQTIYHQAKTGSGDNLPTSADAMSSLKNDHQFKNALKGTGVQIKRVTSGNISHGSRPVKSQNLRMSADQRLIQRIKSPQSNPGLMFGASEGVSNRMLKVRSKQPYRSKIQADKF